jgi:polar amino acid transport system substrate-binding protein
MLLFYVVFKTSKINASVVSIIGFSLIFAFTFYGLLKTGVASIDKGQNEAALALGYNRWIAFFHVILPQALNVVLETYLSEVIALIKNTSIVGYVSVTDITRSSDIIRGRTYDALFPLIVVAAVSVLVAVLLLPVLQIYGHSMNETLDEGDIVVSVKGSSFETGDIIAFYYNNKILVKRVIGNRETGLT